MFECFLLVDSQHVISMCSATNSGRYWWVESEIIMSDLLVYALQHNASAQTKSWIMTKVSNDCVDTTPMLLQVRASARHVTVLVNKCRVRRTLCTLLPELTAAVWDMNADVHRCAQPPWIVAQDYNHTQPVVDTNSRGGAALSITSKVCHLPMPAVVCLSAEFHSLWNTEPAHTSHFSFTLQVQTHSFSILSSDINECLVDNGGCSAAAICRNTQFGHRCECPSGLNLFTDSKTCGGKLWNLTIY